LKGIIRFHAVVVILFYLEHPLRLFHSDSGKFQSHNPEFVFQHLPTVNFLNHMACRLAEETKKNGIPWGKLKAELDL